MELNDFGYDSGGSRVSSVMHTTQLTPFNLKKFLQLQVEKGLLTVEDLDTPSPGFIACNKAAAAAGLPTRKWTNPLRQGDSPKNHFELEGTQTKDTGPEF